MKKLQWIIFFALLLPLSSCFPTPAPDQNAPNVETIVAATYAVISAQTQAALPKTTATPDYTVTPSNTPVPPTITPTNTATFVIYTWTPSQTSTPTHTNTPAFTFTPAITSTPAKFECKLLSQTPANGTVMGSRNDFDWFWTVTNTGTKDWLASDVDYLYISGEKMQKYDSYDLPADTLSGEDIKLGADMVAPKKAGTYTTTWALQRGSKTFCQITLKIIVQ